MENKKQKIDVVNIKCEFEKNHENKILRFKNEVKGEVLNLYIYIVGIDLLESSIKIYLNDENLPKEEVYQFKKTLEQLNIIKQLISKVGYYPSENKNYKLN